MILMNLGDMVRLGIEPDQPVHVSNETGTMASILARPYDIAQGCALMYYPEANVLVPRAADKRSKTPAYKAVVVRVSPSAGNAAMDENYETREEAERRRSAGGMRAC